jgi:PRTRC genetic system ThiF family protein
LLNATNPVTVNLIGAGGTGSKVLTALIEMNESLIALGHAGLFVRLWDDDRVSEANLGRQRFTSCETGLYKSVALINRANRWAGTQWKAETRKFERNFSGKLPEHTRADIYMCCVDTVKARFEMAEMVKEASSESYYSRDRPKYLIDLGNSKDTGQVMLSTIVRIPQPTSKKYETIDSLPLLTDEFGELLNQSELSDDTPSCSLAEALEKQDLYINGTLAQMGCSLLWGLFRNGMTEYRGFFLNLKNFRAQPIPLS